jgi:hypothetical protein
MYNNMDDGFFIWGIIWVVIGAIVGGAIGEKRDARTAGVFLGALFGPLGWIIAACTDNRLECPECKGSVKKGARRCPNCGHSPRPTISELVAAGAFKESEGKKCPFCAETIKMAAVKCRFCGSELQAPKTPPAADYITCPFCVKQISIASLQKGESWCPHCNGKFIVE